MTTKAYLNGWQRLWVLLSLIWLVVFAYFAYTKSPDGSSEQRQYEIETAITALEALIDNKKRQTKNKYAYFDIMAIEDELEQLKAGTDPYELFSNDEWKKYGDLVAYLHSDQKYQSANYKPTEEKHKKRLNALQTTRLSYIGIAVAIWAGTTAIIYGLGLGVGWIIRGFKKETIK